MSKLLYGLVHEYTFLAFQFYSRLSQRAEGVSQYLNKISIIYSFKRYIVEVGLHCFY